MLSVQSIRFPYSVCTFGNVVVFGSTKDLTDLRMRRGEDDMRIQQISVVAIVIMGSNTYQISIYNQ